LKEGGIFDNVGHIEIAFQGFLLDNGLLCRMEITKNEIYFDTGNPNLL
jgi:hypothetical protein